MWQQPLYSEETAVWLLRRLHRQIWWAFLRYVYHNKKSMRCLTVHAITWILSLIYPCLANSQISLHPPTTFRVTPAPSAPSSALSSLSLWWEACVLCVRELCVAITRDPTEAFHTSTSAGPLTCPSTSLHPQIHSTVLLQVKVCCLIAAAVS